MPRLVRGDATRRSFIFFSRRFIFFKRLGVGFSPRLLRLRGRTSYSARRLQAGSSGMCAAARDVVQSVLMGWLTPSHRCGWMKAMLHGAAAVVVGRTVFGRVAGAVELLGGGGDEVDRQLPGPLSDRARLLVGRGEQHVSSTAIRAMTPTAMRQLFDQVIGGVGACPWLRVVVVRQLTPDTPVRRPPAQRGRAVFRRRWALAAPCLGPVERRHDAVATHEQHVGDTSATPPPAAAACGSCTSGRSWSG